MRPLGGWARSRGGHLSSELGVRVSAWATQPGLFPGGGAMAGGCRDEEGWPLGGGGRGCLGQLFSNKESRSSLLLVGRSGGPR